MQDGIDRVHFLLLIDHLLLKLVIQAVRIDYCILDRFLFVVLCQLFIDEIISDFILDLLLCLFLLALFEQLYDAIAAEALAQRFSWRRRHNQALILISILH